MGVWVGGSLGYMDDGQLPAINGQSNATTEGGMATGCFYSYSKTNSQYYVAANRAVLCFDASRCSSAYSRSDNFVIPRRLNVNYIIKY